MCNNLKLAFDTATDAEVAAGVLAVFGDKAEFMRSGKHCHVIVARPIAKIAGLVATWNPTDAFDVNCPHCKPFIEEGAYITWTLDGVYALRLLPDNRYEMMGISVKKFPASLYA